MEAFLPRAIAALSTPANGSCPYEPPFTENAAETIFGNMTFYKFNTYLSGACAVFATLVIWVLQFQHGTHLSRPAEQIKIIRIAHIIPAYSLISWFSILIPGAYYYLYPWLDFVQSICLATFFLLMMEFISPNEDQRSLFFAGVAIKSQSGKAQTKQYNTPAKRIVWYQRKWIAIFQYPIVALLVGVVTDVTQAAGRYCDISYSPKFAHIWMLILDNISVSIAVFAIILVYQTIKRDLAHHRPLSKLVAFKLIVGLGFLQSILFAILDGTNVLKPTAKLTYADVKVGIPTLLTCVEMVPIALFFHYAYSYRPYSMDPSRQPVPSEESKLPAPAPVLSYQGGFLGYRAYLLALNPMEVFEGFIFTFKMATEFKQYTAAMAQQAQGTSMEPLRQNVHAAPTTAYGYGDAQQYALYTEGDHHAYPQGGNVGANYAPPQQPPPVDHGADGGYYGHQQPTAYDPTANYDMGYHR